MTRKRRESVVGAVVPPPVVVAVEQRVHDDICYVCREAIVDVPATLDHLNCPTCTSVVHVRCLPDAQNGHDNSQMFISPRCYMGHSFSNRGLTLSWKYVRHFKRPPALELFVLATWIAVNVLSVYLALVLPYRYYPLVSIVTFLSVAGGAVATLDSPPMEPHFGPALLAIFFYFAAGGVYDMFGDSFSQKAIVLLAFAAPQVQRDIGTLVSGILTALLCCYNLPMFDWVTAAFLQGALCVAYGGTLTACTAYAIYQYVYAKEMRVTGVIQ
jgi:hypothetical protein